MPFQLPSDFPTENLISVRKMRLKTYWCDKCNPGRMLATHNGEPHDGCELWKVSSLPPGWQRMDNGELWCADCVDHQKRLEYTRGFNVEGRVKGARYDYPAILDAAFKGAKDGGITTSRLHETAKQFGYHALYFKHTARDRGYIRWDKEKKLWFRGNPPVQNGRYHYFVAALAAQKIMRETGKTFVTSAEIVALLRAHGISQSGAIRKIAKCKIAGFLRAIKHGHYEPTGRCDSPPPFFDGRVPFDTDDTEGRRPDTSCTPPGRTPHTQERTPSA